MKFGRYLKDHAIDEWRKAYVNYRLLKKQIGKSEAEIDELDDAERVDADVERSPSEPDLERGPAQTREGQRSDISVASGTNEPGSSPGHSEGPPRNDRNASSGDLDRSDSRPPTDHADSDGTSAPLVKPQRSTTQDSQANEDTKSTKTRTRDRFPRRQGSFKLTSAGDYNPKKFRPGFSNSMPLAQLIEKCPPTSRKFFTMLDNELERVQAFYGDREKDAVARFDALKEQWKQLQDHKKEFQAQREREAPLVSVMHKLPSSVPGSRLIRRGLASGKRTPVSGDGHTQTARQSWENDTNHPERQQPFIHHGRPEEYQNARSKLKLATFEYYRSLGMLKSYRVLNRTGFTKAQKKFEKSTRIPCKPWSYKLDRANFVKSTTLDELIRGTEDAFASVFEHGDRKKALERLRDFGQSKRHHFTSWRAGVYMGIALPLFIEGLVKSCQASTKIDIPYWKALMQLFGAMFLPVLFSLLFFLNLASWASARINYILIFELDVRTRLDIHQFIEIPAILLCVLCLFFWAAFSNFWPDHIAPSAYPLAFLVVALVLLLMPTPFLYPSARWWMLRTFCRVLTAGLIAVQFSDFFLGDELNSLFRICESVAGRKSATMLLISDWSLRGFLYCTYNHRWPGDVYEICSLNKTWTTPILASLPAFWRFGQSLRRYLDSDGLAIHALNGGKYSASIIQFWFYYSWRIDGSQSLVRKIIWIISAVINSSYTASWDIVMDWNLLRRDSKNFMLRNELGFFKDHKWVYYIAIIFDIVLRFSWVIYLTDRGPSLQLKGFLVALIEAMRRIVWNAFRVESEHIGNVDGYRVTRNVPLPYVSAVAAPPRDDYEDAYPPQTRRQAFFGFLHNLHKSIVKDFSPLTNISLAQVNRHNSRKGVRTKTESSGKSRGTWPESSSDEDGAGVSDEDGDETPGRDSDAEVVDDPRAENNMIDEVQEADKMMQQADLAGLVGATEGADIGEGGMPKKQD